MPKRHPNILVFAIDSIRRDHMSCYGYPRLTTPYFDRIAARGVLFENAFSPYIPTTPAYSSILTGRDVIGHEMVSLGPKKPLDRNHPTLPEILREAGYRSAVVGFDKGFYRGFDKYLNFEGWVSWEERPARKAENLNAVTLPEIERLHKAGEPWFVFLRHMDPHSPYLPPAPYDTLFYGKNPAARSLPNTMKPVFDFKPFADFFKSWMPPGLRDKDYVIAMYDGALAYMDACCQQIITRLEELGCIEDTLIVITGDHGETLYDHDCFFDHHGLYEPTLVVPNIYYWPGKTPEGARSKAYTLHEDMIPTLLDLAGLRKFARGVKFDGVSLKRYFTDIEATPRSEMYITECTWMRKHGWRTPVWKFWEALEPDFHGKPPVELYNLVEDPAETRNLADREPEIVAALRKRMNQWIRRRERRTGNPNPIHDYQLGTDKYIGSIATAKNLQASEERVKK